MKYYLVKRPDGLYLIRGYNNSAFYSLDRNDAMKFTKESTAKKFADRFGGNVISYEI
jgi:nitrous oxide reductase accessory protein NosL